MSLKNWKNAAFISLIPVAIFAFVIAVKPVAANGGAESSHFPNVKLITQDGKKVHFYDDLIRARSSPSISFTPHANTHVRWKRRAWRRCREAW